MFLTHRLNVGVKDVFCRRMQKVFFANTGNPGSGQELEEQSDVWQGVSGGTPPYGAKRLSPLPEGGGLGEG